MPGKLCNGSTFPYVGELKNSKAYCEGISHRLATNGASISDNPHAVGSEAANCWDIGWTHIHTDAGDVSTLLPNCCAFDRTKVIVP